jgi:DNA polymerase-3 subunit gamma/tau
MSSVPSPLAAAPAREAETRAEPAPVQPAITASCFEDLIALAVERRDLMVKTALERDVRLVRFEDGRLEVALEPGAAKTLAGDLSRKLSNWTGRRWMVIVSAEEGTPTIRAQREQNKAALVSGVAGEPLVQAVLNRFPGAEIVAVRQAGDQTAARASNGAPPINDEIAVDEGEASPGDTVGDRS